ncbi:MAG: AraC family transcriptional regulator, partial [Ruminococcaceae bacterium]|nr:AraC family transcriptional regulator [Oscillospiraceae bacterium]
HLDKTPNQFRNEILCEKAISLLTTTNKSVQEISDTLNFSSTSYFRKILKAHTGKTPLEIRKKSDF